MGGHIVRTIGLVRTKAKIGMTDIVYNMNRLIHLIKKDTLVSNLAHLYIRRGASTVT
jgi:hypothetical protein